MKRIDRLTDDMAEQVKGHHDHRKRLARSIEDLFSQYRRGETEHAPGDELGRDVVKTMQSVFVQKIHTLSESASFDFTFSA